MSREPTRPLGGSRASRDEQILADIAAGDAEALGRLYDRYAPVVLAHCVRVLGDREEAEEVLGEIFLELWQRADRYDVSRASPFAYLMTLTRSRAIDRWRRLQRRPQIVDDVGVSSARADDPIPLDEAISAQRRAAVRAALDTLEPVERRALELSFFQGMSHAEIAAHLGQPLGTVKTRIRRAQLRLRDVLRRGQGEGGSR